MRSGLFARQPHRAPRLEAAERARLVRRPHQAGRLWPGQDLRRSHGAHVRGNACQA